MKRYEIRPTRPMLFAGQRVTPETVLGVLETDMPAKDLVSLVQFASCRLHGDGDDEDESESGTGDFAQFSAAVQKSLADAGITTLAQAALYLRDNGGFEGIGIAKTPAKKLVAAIEAAELPTDGETGDQTE